MDFRRIQLLRDPAFQKPPRNFVDWEELGRLDAKFDHLEGKARPLARRFLAQIGNCQNTTAIAWARGYIWEALS